MGYPIISISWYMKGDSLFLENITDCAVWRPTTFRVFLEKRWSILFQIDTLIKKDKYDK